MKHEAANTTSCARNKQTIPALISIIKEFTEELHDTSVYGRFECSPLYSKLSKHEFYGFSGWLNSFPLYLSFYKKEDSYYFLSKPYSSKVFFTPDTLHKTLHKYFEDLLEEHRFIILLDPPVLELVKFIGVFPLKNKFSSGKELMKSLTSEGYDYNEIEEYCIDLKKEHEKKEKQMNNLHYLKHNINPLYFSIQNDEIGYGCGRMSGTHCYIKFKNHYVLLTDEDSDSEEPAYIIFDSKRDMRTWSLNQNKTFK